MWRIQAPRARRDPDRGRANKTVSVGSLALVRAAGIFLDGAFLTSAGAGRMGDLPLTWDGLMGRRFDVSRW